MKPITAINLLTYYLALSSFGVGNWNNIVMDSCGNGWEKVEITYVYQFEHSNWAYLWDGNVWIYRFNSNPNSPEGFAKIPAGTFLMGSPAGELGRWGEEYYPPQAETQHWVQITRNIHMAETEITKAKWDNVREWGLENGYTTLPPGNSGSSRTSGYAFEAETDDHPVTRVWWSDVIMWCNARSEMERRKPAYYASENLEESSIVRSYDRYEATDLFEQEGEVYVDWNANGYRLPTESEWEYACRAGTTTAFYSGPITSLDADELDPNLDEIGWYVGNINAKKTTRPVGLKEPNDWGLYDMSGNVGEWCWDYIGPYPEGTEDHPVINPRNSTPAEGNLRFRIRRGGGWFLPAKVCRSAARRGLFSGVAYHELTGFRPVLGAQDWSKVVARNYTDGWQQVEINWAYNTGSNWIYLPEASTWIYLYTLNSGL